MSNIFKSIKDFLHLQKEDISDSQKTQNMDLGNIDKESVHIFEYKDKNGKFD